LHVKEVAERLGISEASVYQLCATRRLRHLRIGIRRGVIRIPAEALDEFIGKCSVADSQIEEHA
jgi:excisionase family DNA binding protein